MNWLDVILLCLAGFGFVKGLFDGVIKQVVSLIALLFAIFFCGEVAVWLKDYILALGWFPEEGVSIICYILGFFLILGTLALAGEILSHVVGATPLGILNHLGGGLVGLIFIIAFMSLILNGLEIIDKGSVLISREAKVESRFYAPIKQIVPTIFPADLFSKTQQAINI